MTALLSAFFGCILQGVVKNKNNYPVSVSFNIKVFTADSLLKIDVIRINKLHIWSLNKCILT